MLRIILALLFSLPVYSNTFELSDGGARFSLTITSSELNYQSEGVKKTYKLNKCSQRLARALNGEIISKLPKKPATKGLRFKVDGKEHLIPKESELGKDLLGMDSRIVLFIVEERETCP